MLHWFRTRASCVAALAITALAATSAATFIPHQDDDCHDGPCAFVQHDASAHRVGAPSSLSGEHNHCLVCHWARSFRLRTEARVPTITAAEARELVHVEYFTAAVSAPVAQPPLRSPPASPDLS
jgi:hypothetical protein